MIKKINFYHSLIFFITSILLSGFAFLRENNLTILCLFLILTLGISHGALDNIKGKKLLKFFNIKSMSTFYIGYLLISLSIILIWIIFPKTLLFIFLIVAAYHFGKEDADFLKKEKKIYDEVLYFLKGSSVIISPLLFHKIETILIFQSLNFNITGIIFVENIFLYILLLLSFLSSLFLFFKKNMKIKSLLLMDFFSILILNYFLNPIIAFTIYFCFLHSMRHSLSLMLQLNKNIKKGFLLFVKKALPLTVITALVYLLSINLLYNYYELNESVYKAIFIGLASLTFPHILLEYLIEKKWKLMFILFLIEKKWKIKKLKFY
jgi:Brp/Blh family beta-carotene 15,15'-monooxygenase